MGASLAAAPRHPVWRSGGSEEDGRGDADAGDEAGSETDRSASAFVVARRDRAAIVMN